MQKLWQPHPWCSQGSRPARPRPQTCGWRPFSGQPLPCTRPQLMLLARLKAALMEEHWEQQQPADI